MAQQKQPVLRFTFIDHQEFPSLSVSHSDGMMSLNTTGGTWNRGDAVGRGRLVDRIVDFLRGRGVTDAGQRVQDFLADRERETGRPIL